MKRKSNAAKGNGEAAQLNDAPPPYVVTVDSAAMVRTQIYLTRTEYDFLQHEATNRREPMAAVIRSFIDEKMQVPDDVWTNNPMLRPTPKDPSFEMPSDAALNHDHYLYGTPKKWIRIKGRWVEAPPLPEDYYENDASYQAYNRKVKELENAR